MGIQEVAIFIGFDQELPELESGTDHRAFAAAMVREADQFKEQLARWENPWEYDSAVVEEVIPRYVVAIRLLERHLERNPGGDGRAVAQRVGYLTDVGMLLMGIGWLQGLSQFDWPAIKKRLGNAVT